MTGKESGLTLIELLIVIFIIGIVSTTATPYFNGLVQYVRSYSAIHSLRTTLVLARSEALKRNTTVRVCASMDNLSCSRSKEWSTGWIVYVPDRDQIYIQPGNPILGQSGPSSGLSILKNGSESTLTFSSRGAIGLNRSFSLCSSPDQLPISRLVVYRSGRIRMTEEEITCLN